MYFVGYAMFSAARLSGGITRNVTVNSSKVFIHVLMVSHVFKQTQQMSKKKRED